MDEWDSIDWDEKIDDIVKLQQQEKDQQEVPIASSFTYSEDDGNYFVKNQEKKLKNQERQNNKARVVKPSSSLKEEYYIQPYSLKDLVNIRNFSLKASTFHNLIYETFGQFERFLMTHQMDLTYEVIVELLIIDVALLEVPFTSHNQLLLKEISKLDSFWLQLVDFLKTFLEVKHRDVKFLLTVDMKGFFANIETLLSNLLVNNLYNFEIESVFNEIKSAMEMFKDNEWSRSEQLRNILNEYEESKNFYQEVSYE